MCEITDPELVVRFTENGDIASFNELIGRHIGRIRAIIYGIVLKNADADDLTQEVFLKVMDNAPRFKHKARFSRWLYRIALNTTTDFLRRKGRCPIDYPGDLSPEADRAASPADTLMAEEVGRVPGMISSCPINRSQCFRTVGCLDTELRPSVGVAYN